MATCQEEITGLMQGKINDGLVLLAQKTKTYVDGLNVANKDEVAKQLADAIKPVEDRLNAIDVLNDEDGINTILERVNQLQELLSKDGNLEDILTDLSDINSRIDALVNRVSTLETKQEELKRAQDKLITKTANNTAAIDTKVSCEDLKDAISKIEFTVIATNIDDVFGASDGDGEAV